MLPTGPNSPNTNCRIRNMSLVEEGQLKYQPAKTNTNQTYNTIRTKKGTKLWNANQKRNPNPNANVNLSGSGNNNHNSIYNMCIYGWMVGWMDGWMDEWKDRWIWMDDGWMKVCICASVLTRTNTYAYILFNNFYPSIITIIAFVYLPQWESVNVNRNVNGNCNANVSVCLSEYPYSCPSRNTHIQAAGREWVCRETERISNQRSLQSRTYHKSIYK